VNIVHRERLEVVEDKKSKKPLKDLESMFDKVQDPIINQLEKVAKGETFKKFHPNH
jgi:hypothetical protein